MAPNPAGRFHPPFLPWVPATGAPSQKQVEFSTHVYGVGDRQAVFSGKL
ncbi:hypothetical protein JMJ77_0006562 [Colletotrichum scovillei]|uniref:Uncharacterized protein n=1 Tax=Colletotrichum scovillei TaxID=1209932 RepID=A0A9P7RJG8_9PEZI|nr:hypothetical protein JMJ77_0006562 [Colletotrichum scovillei]KAG7077835.1 hypothetical protein JMJ76_0015077 [Colletotrichum scovillei]KAG7084898.1 hypothetical protein JMJ78_0010328 [Colletotrichum scovillei]